MDPNLIRQVYPGYAGWGTAEMLADFNATGGAGKGNGASLNMGPGGVPQFSFDYEGAARQAYGELGTYYDRLLRESQGDLNKALARLTQDYERGLRIKREDTTFAEQGMNLADQDAMRRQQLAEQRVRESALARGLYQKSAYDPASGMGIPDTERANVMGPYFYAEQQRQRQRQQLRTGLKRYEESAGIEVGRQREDLPEKQKRYEHELEQQRRRESAGMAESRGARAYQNYLSRFSGY